MSESTIPAAAPSTPPEALTIEERVTALEARQEQILLEQRRQRRALRYQSFDQDLLMNSLQYLVMKHPASDDDFRSQILEAFARRALDRDTQRALDREEDDADSRSSARIKI